MAEKVNFDSARAQQWKNNVDEEFQAVEQVLNRVRQLSSTIPGEDDAIIQWIVKVGEAEEEAWSRLADAYHKVSEETSNIINRMHRGIENIVDRVSDLKSNFRL